MIPNPGSPEAKAQGCRCPVIDNARGHGAGTMPDGRPVFFFDLGCSLHGAGDWQDRNDAELRALNQDTGFAFPGDARAERP